jgi:hypothetical protein
MRSKDRSTPPDPGRGAEIAERIASATTSAEALEVVHALTVAQLRDLAAWAEAQR